MRYRVNVEPGTGGSFTVTVTAVDAGPGAFTPSSRILEVCNDGVRGYPYPQDASERPGTADSLGQICGGDAVRIRALIASINSQAAIAADIERLGRYMFITLLGDKTWSAIQNRAAGKAIQLELAWRTPLPEFSRLPWEAMHDGSNYLVARPGQPVAISRVVAGARSPMMGIEIPLKVLFVLSSNPDDPAIEPGAEYLCLMRRLEATRLSLHTHLLLSASPKRLQEAVSSFQPSVVHFIGHGGIRDGKGFVRLVPDEGGAAGEADAGSLHDLLSNDGALPILVLNACYSAASEDAVQQAVPLAVELVEKGFPLVVGMGGRVSDVSCRLFTCGFYEAIARGVPIADACARGRREGLMLRAGGADSIDWALPTLVLPEGDGHARVHEVHDRLPNLQQARDLYRQVGDPVVFCDRVELLAAFQELLRDGRPTPPAAGAPVLPRNSFRILAVQLKTNLPAGQQYGLSRLLEEMAMKAYLDGFAPCLVRKRLDEFSPRNLAGLVENLADEIQQVAALLGVATLPALEVHEVMKAIRGNAAALGGRVGQLLQRGRRPDDKDVLAAAIQEDLLGLERSTGRRPLVLFDNLHGFTDLKSLFEIITQHGLGTTQCPVSVVFAVKRLALPEHTEQGKAVQEFLETRKKGFVRVMDLGLMANSEDEGKHVYQQFLFGLKPPLVPRPLHAKTFYELMHDSVCGVPSMLLTHAPNAVKFSIRQQWLEVATDDEFLKGLVTP